MAGGFQVASIIEGRTSLGQYEHTTGTPAHKAAGRSLFSFGSFSRFLWKTGA
jgi:hypothetical protein